MAHPLVALEKLYHILKMQGKRRSLEGVSGREKLEIP